METRLSRTAVIVLVAVVLAACSPGPTPTPAPTPVPTPTPAPTPVPTPKPKVDADIVVGFIQSDSQTAWRVANTASFVDTASARGIKLTVSDAAGKPANQIDAFHRFNADPKINVIVLDPIDTFGFDDVLKEAQAAGKIVIIEDRAIGSDPKLYTTHVGADFVAEGQKAGAAMCELLKGSTKKRVAEITGPVGSSISIGRAEGFRDKMGDCGIPDPVSLGLSQPGDWGANPSKAVMAGFLKKTRDIQGVLAHNDEEAIGAVAAIKEAKLRPGKDIQIVGFDASADGFKYLISGELGADIEYTPLLAPQVFDAALKAMNHDPSLPKFIAAQESFFTAAMGVDALNALHPSRKY